MKYEDKAKKPGVKRGGAWHARVSCAIGRAGQGPNTYERCFQQYSRLLPILSTVFLLILVYVYSWKQFSLLQK